MRPARSHDLTGVQSLLPRTHYRWVILLLMFLFFVINHADRGNIGVVLPYLKKEFLLTNLQAGALASFFFLGYAITQLPAGLVMSRVGPRVMTSLSLFGFSIFTFLIGTAPGAAVIKWFRLGVGFFEGPAGIGAGALIKAWFPRKEQATAMGLYMSSSQIALVLVPPICVAIMIHWGWRMVFYLFAIPGVIMAAVWYVFVRNRPEESRFCNGSEREYIHQSSPGYVRKRTGKPHRLAGWIPSSASGGE